MKTYAFFSLLLVSFLLAPSAQGQTLRTVQATDVSTVTTCRSDEDCDDLDDGLDDRLCADGTCSTVLLDTWATLHLVAVVKDGQTVGFEVWSPRSNRGTLSGPLTASQNSQSLRTALAAGTTPEQEGQREPIEVSSFSWGLSSSVSASNESLSSVRTTGSSTPSMSSFSVCGTFSDATTQVSKDYCWVLSPPGTDVSEASMRTHVMPHVLGVMALDDWMLSACTRSSPCPLRGSLAQATAPRDAASGLPTGKRQHKPVSVTGTTEVTTSTDIQGVDKSSPVLIRVLTLQADNGVVGGVTGKHIATYNLKLNNK